jgi:hypothetical protein
VGKFAWEADPEGNTMRPPFKSEARLLRRIVRSCWNVSLTSTPDVWHEIYVPSGSGRRFNEDFTFEFRERPFPARVIVVEGDICFRLTTSVEASDWDDHDNLTRSDSADIDVLVSASGAVRIDGCVVSDRNRQHVPWGQAP